MADIYETGETVVEAVARTTEGRVRFELTGRLLTDDDGTAVGFAGTGRDVTDRRDETWQLARENERLAEFADVLAHDLRNPLSVASGHLALARARVDDPEATEQLDRLAAAHSRIETIIADIRSAAARGAGNRDRAGRPGCCRGERVGRDPGAGRDARLSRNRDRRGRPGPASAAAGEPLSQRCGARFDEQSDGVR
ncbi:histidine kinase dimerization/phospho-acceptor domain-containing protein [Halomicroarcula sp. GCM10025709]|uniref:histidine kinase dimerization/phospho-acceptor domain-containing protein n=1 Tax=Halomicroarcula sp. GCM10025709 TaxID=3252669 RepID=UPI00361AFD69